MLESARRGAISGNRITLLQGLDGVAAYLAYAGHPEPAGVLLGLVNTASEITLAGLRPDIIDALVRLPREMEPEEMARLRARGSRMTDQEALEFATVWIERIERLEGRADQEGI